MTEDVLEQAASILKSAKIVALLLPAEPTLDHVAASYGFHGLIGKLGGEAEIITAGTIEPLPFIRNSPAIKNKIGSPDQFAIKVSTANAQPGELRYEIENDSMVIYLKPKQGMFKPDDVKVLSSQKKYDALIAIGVTSLDQLGTVYTDNPGIFFDTPIVNIDNNPGNEYFGTVNMVDVKASSVSELAVDVVSRIDGAIEDDMVSTSLLAGMIERTQSFRDPRTTPNTLSKAAKLVKAGARQQDIIQHLYKTKSFNLLQLWGRALARLVSMPEQSMLFSAVTKSDFEKTGTDIGYLPQVLKELIEMVSGFSVIAIAAETENGIEIYIAGLPHARPSSLLQKIGGPSQPAFPLAGKYEFVKGELQGQTAVDAQNSLAEALVS